MRSVARAGRTKRTVPTSVAVTNVRSAQGKRPIDFLERRVLIFFVFIRRLSFRSCFPFCFLICFFLHRGTAGNPVRYNTESLDFLGTPPLVTPAISSGGASDSR